MKAILVILVVMFGVYDSVYAEVQYGYGFDLRSYPLSASANANANYTGMIWDDRNNGGIWKYGFYKLAGKAWVHGAADFSLEVNPLSIIQLGYLRSTSSRFYEIKPYDCLLVECRGVLGRDQYYLNVVLGYADWILQAGTGVVNYSIQTGKSQFALEGDSTLGNSQQETNTYSQAFIGKNMDELVVGWYWKSSQMKYSKDLVNNNYLIARKKLTPEQSAFIGVGVFESSGYSSGFSILAGSSWSFGESLALF